MRHVRTIILGLSLLLTVGLPVRVLGQGSLTPPGPPGPTMKSLDQIEPRALIASLPFTIAAPGAYYLTTNLTSIPGQNGIVIQADQVTLDLNGFVLRGANGSSNGIATPSPRAHVTIRGGVVTGWGVNGVDLGSATDCRLVDLRVVSCDGYGLVAGARALVEGCSALTNGEGGIVVGPGSTVRASSAALNATDGLLVQAGGSVIDCVVDGNGQDGVGLGDGCVVRGTGASQNGRHGISGGIDTRVMGCTTRSNKERGVTVSAGSQLTGTMASDNGQIGINTGARGLVTECTAQLNRGPGIRVELASTVRGCTAHGNGADGIVVTAECTVTDNQCTHNSNVIDAAGVHATDTKNLIRGNTVTSNDRGISLDASGNVVVQNASANNSLPYRVTGPQVIGQILQTLDDPSTANQPWANFAY